MQELGTRSPATVGTTYARGGRPVAGTSLGIEYSPDILPVIEEMGRDGKGLFQIAAKLRIPSGVLLSWERSGRYPELQEYLARARDLAAAYWLDTAAAGVHEVVQTKNGSYTRVNERLLVWVAERAAQDLRQADQVDVRALVGSLDYGKLSNAQIAALTTPGANVLQVLGLGSGELQQLASGEESEG